MKNKKFIGKFFFGIQIIVLLVEVFSALVPFFYKSQGMIGTKSIISFILLFYAIGFNLSINSNINIRDFYRICIRFAMDTMDQKHYVIEYRLDSGKITKKQAEEQKNEIQNEFDRYRLYDVVITFVHFLDYIVIALIFSSIVIKSIMLRKPTFFWAYYITLICCIIETSIYHIFTKEHFVETIFERLTNLIHNTRNNKVKAGIKVLYFKQFLSDYSVHRLDSKFYCSLRFGNLLKDKGDILLCPIGEGFKPANPLAHWVVEKEGKYIKTALKNLEGTEYNKTEFSVFIPCKKLKYRGIVFTCVDFHSENRTEVNAKRIADGFLLAKKHECKKLSCPIGFLYEGFHPDSCKEFFSQFDKVIRTMDEDAKEIDYLIEFVIKRNLENYSMFKDYQDFFE